MAGVCDNMFVFLLIVTNFVSYLRCEEDELAEQDANPDFTLVDDMILAPEQYDVLYNDESRRTGLMQAVRTWPNATVPYLLDNNFTAAEKSLIRAAMNIVQKGSCVKFLRIQDTKIHKDYVHIQPGHGCASTVGFWGGKQIIYLQKVGCMDMGRILHELVHVLGFFHMHTALERDKYIDVVWSNILPSAVINFVSYESDVSMFGTSYDIDSITHYPPTSFSKNGSDTIVPKKSVGNKVMGQRSHLSAGDVTRLNRMYNCL